MHPNICKENRGELLREEKINLDALQLYYTLHRKFVETEQRYACTVTVTSIFNGETETVSAEDISSCEDVSLNIFSIICRASVTPCTLYDVLEDLL